MANNFCPLTKNDCNPRCVLLQNIPSAYGLVKQCSFAQAVKKSGDSANANILLELRGLLKNF